MNATKNSPFLNNLAKQERWAASPCKGGGGEADGGFYKINNPALTPKVSAILKNWSSLMPPSFDMNFFKSTIRIFAFLQKSAQVNLCCIMYSSTNSVLNMKPI